MTRQSVRKQETFSKLLKASKSNFARFGLSAASIDQIATDAGVTSGAFYAHMISKENAFDLAFQDLLEEFGQNIAEYQTTYGSGWIARFVTDSVLDAQAHSKQAIHALPALMSDVGRIDATRRKVFEPLILKIADQISTGISAPSRNEKISITWTLIALLLGTRTIATTLATRAQIDTVSRSVQLAICELIA